MADQPAIAVVGVGCRYPDAADPGELWEMVLARRRAFRPIPAVRLSLDDYGGPGPGNGPLDPDTTYVRMAAVLEGWRFDRARFRVPGAAYRVTDPAHWLALDVAGQTLESAGFPGGDGLDRHRVAVVLGNTMAGEFSRAALIRLRWPYLRRVLTAVLAQAGLDAAAQGSLLADAERACKAPFPEPNDESLAGGLANTIAGRICNHFDLHGGGYTVDGACSSSLLAVCAACGALLDGQADLVLAGGVDLSLDPFELVGFARAGALAIDEMRVYDEEPTGFLPGEGCGMVALMRAPDAAVRGLTPWAVIRGWGVSSDGRGGLTRPEASGQLLALRRAYRRAGFGLETVALLEGHGTGTAVGDTAEIGALIEAHDGRPRPLPAALGSIKANIGHTKAAAGVAGLIKAVLAVRHQVIPPATGCVSPHKLLTAPGSPLRISEAGSWPAGPLRAGVSAMGFGGINTHVVVEAAAPRRQMRRAGLLAAAATAPPLSHEVFAFGAPAIDGLAATLARVAKIAPAMSFAEHTDLAAALAAPRERPDRYRLALVSRDPGELAHKVAQALAMLGRLAGAAEGTLIARPAGIFAGHGDPGPVGLLFPGQGAPVRATAGVLGQVFPRARAYFGATVPDGDPAGTAHAQPAIVRASLAGLRWLESMGVRARAAAGHSLGEITALCWAGALTEPDAADLVTERGRIMSTLGTQATGMASVAADAATVIALLPGTSLVIAADNGATQVVAGSLADLDRLADRAGRRGLAVRRLRVSHAFHSPAVAAAAPALAAKLAGMSFSGPRRTVCSTVLGRRLAGDDHLPDLLVAQLTSPVLFRRAAELLAAECAVLIEVGPGRALTALMPGIAPVPSVALDAGADSAEGITQVAAALFAVGATGPPRPLFARRFFRPFDLWHDFEFLANPCEQAPALPAPPIAGERPQAARPPAPALDQSQAAGDEQTDVLGLLKRLIAETVELPVEMIRSTDRLLADLHLSSLQAGQLAARAAAECQRLVPAAPLSLADASVADLAVVVDSLPEAGEPAAAVIPAGVADWHRILIEVPEPAQPPTDLGLRRRPPGSGPESQPAAPQPGYWEVLGTGVLREPVEQMLPAVPPGIAPSGILHFLPEEPDDADIAALVAAARQAVGQDVTLTVVDHGDTASGFLATVAQEHPDAAIRLIRVPGDGGGQVAAAVAGVIGGAAEPGFREIVIDRTGQVALPGYRPLVLPPPGELPIAAKDVVLVTGGGRGIGFETALALASRAGVRLGLLGRANPEADDELRANLGRLDEAGVTFHYEQADVADATATGVAVARIVAALGPVVALIHASGVNRPARFAALTGASFADHAAAKHHGLRMVLDTLDTSRLRVVLTYGSVIGRFGLVGEAHYALANGRMREAVRAAAGRLPDCWVCNIDWTVWSGAGMGERLEALDQLLRAGVSPLPADRGVELLIQLLASRPPVSSVLITGRLPQLNQTRTAVGFRFVQRTPVRMAGVELVTEADLRASDDPYLADHQIDGMPVLPAVCALEAMAQAAALLSGEWSPVGVTGGRFGRPVVVPPGGMRVVRVCALLRDDGDVDVVLRSDETSFAVDHFSCRVTARPASPPRVAAQRTPVPPHQASGLYGALFFHGPAFRRLRRFERLDATACTAVLAGAPGPRSPLLLGDPARNDASIHLLQACVPHRRLLPVGCDRFTIHCDAGPTQDLVLAAAERRQSGQDYSYDVVVRDAGGRAVLSWAGLRLRDVGPIDAPPGWPRVLLGPYLQRSVTALLGTRRLRLHVRAAGPRTADRATRHRPASESSGEITRSRSHLDGVLLEASAPPPVACDWEPVADPSRLRELRSLIPWTGLPGQLLRLTGEPEAHVLTRLWTVRECLWKAGRSAPGPVVIQGAYEQGWVLLRAGDDAIASAVLHIDGQPDPVAVAVLARETPCDRISNISTS